MKNGYYQRTHQAQQNRQGLLACYGYPPKHKVVLGVMTLQRKYVTTTMRIKIGEYGLNNQ